VASSWLSAGARYGLLHGMTCTESEPAGHARCIHTHHAVTSPLVTTRLWSINTKAAMNHDCRQSTVQCISSALTNCLKLPWDMQPTRMRSTDNSNNNSDSNNNNDINSNNSNNNLQAFQLIVFARYLLDVQHRCKAKLHFITAGVFLQVSEGLDFADSNARAVLIFGIPFPNVKDTKVGLKKAYNDAGQRTHRLLGGDQWYTQQAFRCVCPSVPALCLCTSLCLSVRASVCLSIRLSICLFVCPIVCLSVCLIAYFSFGQSVAASARKP